MIILFLGLSFGMSEIIYPFLFIKNIHIITIVIISISTIYSPVCSYSDSCLGECIKTIEKMLRLLIIYGSEHGFILEGTISIMLLYGSVFLRGEIFYRDVLKRKKNAFVITTIYTAINLNTDF